MSIQLELNQIKKQILIPGAEVQFIHSANMTLAYWNFEAGVELPEHSHPHEQISQLMSGNFVLTVDGTPHHLSPGSIVVIPPNAIHSGIAETDCHIIDAFYPVREDYR